MTTKKEEFDVSVTDVFNNQYYSSTESFFDFNDALEYAKPYCLDPIRYSVEFYAYQRVFDEIGDQIESEMTEVIDVFSYLGLSEEDILAKAESASMSNDLTPKDDFEALVLALVLGITADTDEKIARVQPLIDEYSARFDEVTIERAKKEALVRANAGPSEIVMTGLGPWLEEIQPHVAAGKLLVGIPERGDSFGPDNAQHISDYASNYFPVNKVEAVTVRLFTGELSSEPFENGKGFLPIKMLASLAFSDDGEMFCLSAEDTQWSFETDSVSGEKLPPMGRDILYSDWPTIVDLLDKEVE